MENFYFFLRCVLNVAGVAGLFLAWDYLIIPLWRQIRVASRHQARHQ